MNYERTAALAARAANAGDWSAARGHWLSALALAPDPASAMLELSYVESLDGHYRAARDWALQAARRGPASQEARRSLVHRLRTFNEVELLRGLSDAWTTDPDASPSLLSECARQLSILNVPDAAMRCVQASLRLAPGDLGSRLLHAQLLANAGHLEEAEAAATSVLRAQPRIAGGWWILARLRKQTTRANHVAQLQALLRQPGLRPPDVAALARALHKELDDLGDHDAAWQALELMCRARRASEPYDRAETDALMQALRAWPVAHAKPYATSSTDKTPVFIIGMHRSGTTLLEQLLDASDEVQAVGELNDFTAAMRDATDHYCKATLDGTVVARAAGADFAGVGRRYMQGMAWRLGEARYFTDKQPANFLNAGFICKALPTARLVHLVRDPAETCFSNLRELFTGTNAYSYDQRDLAHYFLHYHRLMAHWHAAFPGRILDVSYARLTADPEGTMREVAAFCGIAYTDAMRDTGSSQRTVSTASSVQVREGVQRQARPKWAPYARQLQPLVDALRAGGCDVPGGEGI